MLKVGICGTIGSGKSTVCRIFEDMGVPVYYADDRAKSLMVTQSELIEKITDAFGSQCYVDGVLDRRYLASQIFGDDSKRLLLNSIVHPVVCKNFVEWAESQTAQYVIIESAILFESGLADVIDRSIAVLTDQTLALERAAARDGADIEAIKARMAVQRSADELRKMADYTIYNIDLNELPNQVAEVDSSLRKL